MMLKAKEWKIGARLWLRVARAHRDYSDGHVWFALFSILDAICPTIRTVGFC